MHGESLAVGTPASFSAVEQRLDVARGGDADRVAEAQLVAAEVEQARGRRRTTCATGTAPSQGSPKHIDR